MKGYISQMRLAIACAGLLAVFQTTAIAEPVTVDFSKAMQAISFDPATADGNKNAEGEGNGLLDAAELALVAAVLADENFDRSEEGGVGHDAVYRAYEQALASATADLKALSATYPDASVVVAGYAMAGRGSFEGINAMCSAFGSPLSGDYERSSKLDAYLGPDGDADGDGVSNRVEYGAHIASGIPAYVAAALDPSVRLTAPAKPAAFWCPMRGRPCAKVDYSEAGSCAECGMPLITKVAYEKMEDARQAKAKTVGILLFNGYEALDVYGPVEMWGYVNEFNLVTVAETAGPVTSTQGLTTEADYSFADCPPLDILMVPGGIGTRRELKNDAMLAFLRESSEKAHLVTSVCTGSALLARAGVLDGHRATSNKRFFELAVEQSDKVTWVRQARWVDDGRVITSSGVSAGIDMALHVVRRLYGEERALGIAAGTEYVWNDDAGHDPFALPKD